MNEESSFQGQPTYVGHTSNKRRLVTIFFVVLLLLIAGLGALYLLGNSAKHTSNPTNPISTQTVSPSTSLTVTPTQAATPSAALSPTSSPTAMSVSVLNGSGTVGAAGKVADALKNAGFTSVTTGNANAYNYTGLTVYVKDKANLATIQKDISSLDPSAKITASVDPTISSDVEVIVGK